MPENVSEAVKKPLKRLAEIWQRHKVVLSCLFLFGLIAWVFAPSLNGGFLFYDENDEIVFEPHINSGITWGNFIWAFTSLGHNNWYPINWLSHMLDCELFGVEPWGHHLTSILLHAANSTLVFLVLRKLTGAFWRSVLVALLFGLHPMRVESVAWICERKDVLSLFFWLLAMLAYVRYAAAIKSNDTRPVRFYLLSLLFFSFGLMSKAMLVTFPFVLLLLDYWPLDLRSHKSKFCLLLEKIPFLLLAAACSWLVLKSQQLGDSMGKVENLPAAERAANAMVSYVLYLGKFFWPENLAIYMPRPDHWPLLEVLAAACAIAGMTVMVLKKRESKPYLVVGWFWYLITLLPVIGLIGINGGDRSIAIRYAYIPLIGFVFSLVWLLADFTKNWRHQGILAVAIAMPLLFVSALRARIEIGYFKSDASLWNRTVSVTEGMNNWMPHYCLGTILVDSPTQPDAVLNEFKEVVRLKPDFALGQLSLGTALQRRGEPDAALASFQRVLRLNPDLGRAWYNCGTIYFSKGQLASAADCFNKAMERHEDQIKCRSFIGLIRQIQTQARQANTQMRNELTANSNRFEIYNNLAWLLASTGDETVRNGEEAVKLARRACELTGYQLTQCVGTLSAAYAEAGNFDEAVKMSKLACSMAEKTGDQVVLQKNKMLLELFNKQTAYHEIPQEILDDLNISSFH